MILLKSIFRIILIILKLPYYYIFKNTDTLTANPKEHLKRARKLLKKNKNSLLLYAALEIRFALERIVQMEAIFCETISKRYLDEYDPSKKRKALSKIDDNINYSHKIYLINKQTGEKMQIGQYKPIDQYKIDEIKGKLGDLLHPKDGLNLGIANDIWYKNTKTFLQEANAYLLDIIKDNRPYFAYSNMGQFELIKED